ncbi:MAG: hypothetical protein AAGC74_00910 [Verrucomicrobiota bacterium]
MVWLVARAESPEPSELVEVAGVPVVVRSHTDGSRSVDLSGLVISRAVQFEDGQGNVKTGCETGFSGQFASLGKTLERLNERDLEREKR